MSQGLGFWYYHTMTGRPGFSQAGLAPIVLLTLSLLSDSRSLQSSWVRGCSFEPFPWIYLPRTVVELTHLMSLHWFYMM